MANVVVDKTTYKADPLYQWDKNQKLVIKGLSLASIPEIHFTNDAMDRAIVVQSTMDNAGIITVAIPNSILQKPYKVKAYVCIYEGATFKSLYSIVITMIARNKPNDYSFEDNVGEVYSFNALENYINNTLVTLRAEHETTIAYMEKKADEMVANANKINDVIDDNNALKNELTAKYDETNALYEGTQEQVSEALNIAKGKNQAHVFDTTDDFLAWISEESNAGKYQVGDNIYIVDTEVPDWWISEVLTEADAETGYFYGIAQLETQKVDLTEINTTLGAIGIIIEGTSTSTNTMPSWTENARVTVPATGVYLIIAYGGINTIGSCTFGLTIGQKSFVRQSINAPDNNVNSASFSWIYPLSEGEYVSLTSWSDSVNSIYCCGIRAVRIK